MDIKAELNYFKAIDLEELVKGGEQIPDNIRNSIFLYNKAIESLRSGSEDIAIIELKKAVAMNPQFNEALNLLGVCYSYTGENEKAVEVFKRVLKSESNSVYAVKFMQRAGLGDVLPTEQKPRLRTDTQQDQKSAEPLKRIRDRKPDKKDKIVILKNKNTISMAIAAGAGLAAGLLISLLISAAVPDPEPVQLPPKQEEIDAAVNEAKDEFDKQYSELKSKYESLQNDWENAVKQADYYKASLRLYEVEDMADKREYRDAADMLLLMKTVEFRDAEKEKYDALYNKIMPQAAKSAYETGYKQYNARQYEDALKSFEKVKLYDPQYSKMDAAMYYTGRCYQIMKETRSAIAVYQELADNYPASWYTRNAQVRLNELTKVP